MSDRQSPEKPAPGNERLGWSIVHVQVGEMSDVKVQDLKIEEGEKEVAALESAALTRNGLDGSRAARSTF